MDFIEGHAFAASTALSTNKAHQYALKVYSEKLENELEALDNLLVRLLKVSCSLYTHACTASRKQRK
jgi:hypothetical protein